MEGERLRHPALDAELGAGEAARLPAQPRHRGLGGIDARELPHAAPVRELEEEPAAEADGRTGE